MAVGKTKTGAIGANEALIITRVFDAPRELVWKAWTAPEHLMRWWGQIIFLKSINKNEKGKHNGTD